MSDFLPYAIIAGAVIVFFVICYVLFAGNSSEEKKEKSHAEPTQPDMGKHRPALHIKQPEERKTAAAKAVKNEGTAPVPKISTVTVREREERPAETAFVTTKGEAVRKNGKIVYEETARTKKQTPDELEITRVLSRDEILAAMEKADTENTAVHEDAEKEKPALADMAAVVSADLAAKETVAEKDTPKRNTVVAEVMAENAEVANHRREGESVPRVTDKTQIIDPAEVRRELDKKEASREGAVPDTSDSSKKAAVNEPWGKETSGRTAKPSVSAAKARPSIWDTAAGAKSPVVTQCVDHFLNQFGIVTPEMKEQVSYITEAAFQRIGCVTDAEQQTAIMPFQTQEALQHVQKAYAAQPNEYVASLTLQAFYDIVHCSPISTRYLVAVDALKVMPYLSGAHYKILAILLIFLYSRNSHNVDAKSFRQYIDKYVIPFMEDFPTERAYYQQLDYLRCTAFESKETRFAEILSDSYSLLFRYRGITEEELRKALKGQRLSSEFVVPSFNSPLIKLAMVDESMATRFFRRAGIADRTMQDHIMRLAKKRPASFAGEEALDIMEDISPVLADLSDIWDSTMLRVSTLSLLGLYLAQGYVHEMIGEEFDLSRWLD